MEFVFEKIRASSSDKNGLIGIYSAGKKYMKQSIAIKIRAIVLFF